MKFMNVWVILMASFFEMAVQDHEPCKSKIKFHPLYLTLVHELKTAAAFPFFDTFFLLLLFFRLVQSNKKHYLQETSLIKYWFIYLTWTIITNFGLWLHAYCMIEMYVNQPFLHLMLFFSLLDWCVQILEDAHECDTIRLIPVLCQSYSPITRSVF